MVFLVGSGLESNKGHDAEQSLQGILLEGRVHGRARV